MKTSEFTQDEIDLMAQKIRKMSQYELCRDWRFSKAGDPRFRKDLITSSGKSLGDLFSETLKEKGGFTPEISKQLGW